MAATRPLVSIVTPVHNEAKHLPECIESVLAQTYRNWEYTIVDNQSDDASFEIAGRYAAKDARIRVLRNTTFLPALENHNNAIRQISKKSKYCKIVFADDWMFPECLERMMSVAEERASIGVVGSYCLHGTEVKCTGLPYRERLVSGREICRRHLIDRVYVFGSANCVLYRADLVRRRRSFFNEENIHADTELCFALLEETDFGFVHQVLTFTRVRPHSLSTISSDLRTDFGGMLQIIVRYGRLYLSEAEFARCLADHLGAYYRFLAKALLQNRDRRFWRYHAGQLKIAGVNLNKLRLARALVETMCDAALRPKDTAERLVRANRRRAEARRVKRSSTPREDLLIGKRVGTEEASARLQGWNSGRDVDG
jgi:glycosyltransferase involved in cell wall biosynthesis